MNFAFTDDQMEFFEAIATMLRTEVTADRIRARWDNQGVDADFLRQAHELGLSSMLVPESLGGLGLGMPGCAWGPGRPTNNNGWLDS